MTSATMPPRSPADFSSTRESFGIGYSPSISRRMSTLCWPMPKPRIRPMLTPCVCTGSPLRIPPAFGTFVVTMYRPRKSAASVMTASRITVARMPATTKRPTQASRWRPGRGGATGSFSVLKTPPRIALLRAP